MSRSLAELNQLLKDCGDIFASKNESREHTRGGAQLQKVTVCKDLKVSDGSEYQASELEVQSVPNCVHVASFSLL